MGNENRDEFGLKCEWVGYDDGNHHLLSNQSLSWREDSTFNEMSSSSKAESHYEFLDR